MPRFTMTGVDAPRSRRVRVALLLVSAWIAFAFFQTAVARALSAGGAEDWVRLLGVDLVIALYWAAVSVPVALYHRRVRTRQRHLLAIASAHIPLLFVVALTDIVVSRLASAWMVGRPARVSFLGSLTYYADFEIVSYVAIVAVAEMLLTRARLRERERAAARLESLLARARLEFLEAQLQPHFLFNALGAVSELAYEAPAAALRVTQALSSMIRGALSTRSGEVTLGEELVAVEPYLDIQRTRFADWLRIDYDVDDAAVDCLVPRFVLQPLLENAIRHGLTGRTAPGAIAISASVQGEELILRVADNGVGLQSSRGSAGYGIGLGNVRERLAVLHGGGDRLRLFSDDAAGTVAEVTMQRRMRGDSYASARTMANAELAPFSTSERSEPGPISTPRSAAAHPALTTLAVWTVCSLVWTQQSFAYLAVRNRLAERSWQSVAGGDMSSALIWAALTPLVFLLTRWIPIRRPWLPVTALAYIAGGIGIAVLHPVLLQRIMNPRGPLWSPIYQSTLIVDCVIVCVLVALGHRRQLAAWLRDREVTSAVLDAEVREARARAARLHAISPFLLHALERIATVVRTQPQLTEQLLARLADYLRVAVECSDERGVTPEREEALNYCLARFQERGGLMTPSSPGA